MRIPLLLIAAGLPSPAFAHDLFLEFAGHVLEPRSTASVALVNGAFGKSDNVITRDRMVDVSIVGPTDERMHPGASDWHDVGKTSQLRFETGEVGTYVLGVSTAPRMIELTPEAFNSYLKHDGVLDVLEARKRNGELELPARERYSKHVKSVVQVGELRSEAFDTVLGYPIEIVPLANATDLHEGDELPVRVLFNGAPLASQLVYASHGSFHAHDESGSHVEAFSGRTDESGRFVLPVNEAGRWYVRLIHMKPSPEPDVDYESFWATLTFQVAEGTAPPPSRLTAAAAAAALAIALLATIGITRSVRSASISST